MVPVLQTRNCLVYNWTYSWVYTWRFNNMNKTAMKEIDEAAIMWNKTKLEYWKKRWYELIKKATNEMEQTI
jgi:hypothetical protein